MADHIAVARRRREDVEARRAWRRCRPATGALCATSKKALARTGKVFPFVVIQEAGLDGSGSIACFGKRIESHVVDPALITITAGERRPTGSTAKRWFARCWHTSARRTSVCAMVKAPDRGRGPPSPLSRAQGADRRAGPARQSRQGLLFSQGISGYQPLRHDRRERLDTPRPAMVAYYRIIWKGTGSP